MTAHTCTTITPGCYRCELGRDEVEHAIQEARADAQTAWLEYRDRYTRSHCLTPRQVASQLRRREFIAGYLAAEGIEAER